MVGEETDWSKDEGGGMRAKWFGLWALNICGETYLKKQDSCVVGPWQLSHTGIQQINYFYIISKVGK